MTELTKFEEEVGFALASLMSYGLAGDRGPEIARELAPRVAAAMQASARAMELYELGKLDPVRDRDTQIQRMAITALRGEKQS